MEDLFPALVSSAPDVSRASSRHPTAVFKPYAQRQQLLFPQELSEWIPSDHLVRVVDRTLEQANLGALYASYAGGGTSAYDPRMLLKVLVYGYLMKTYSSRRIAKLLREDIHAIWLSGHQSPDFRTLNNFRSGRLKPLIDTVFASTLELLVEGKYVDLKHYFVDGTFIEADANRHTAVWRKNVERSTKTTKEKITAVIAEIERINTIEQAEYGDRDLEECGQQTTLTREVLEAYVQKLNQLLEKKRTEAEPVASSSSPAPSASLSSPAPSASLSSPASSASSSAPSSLPAPSASSSAPSSLPAPSASSASSASLPLPTTIAPRQTKATVRRTRTLMRQLTGKLLPALAGYDEQHRLLGDDRNSYSKTDHDATFTRMKDQTLRPAYTVMIGTQGQFILNYSIHQKPSDTVAFIPHMKKFATVVEHTDILKHSPLLTAPMAVIGDSAFGSQENYEYLETAKIEPYLKYNAFHPEQTRKYRNDPYRKEAFVYEKQADHYRCPEGRVLPFVGTRSNETSTGFKQRLHVYQSQDCSGCPGHARCAKSKEHREFTVNRPLEVHKARARELLNSDTGWELRRKRGTDVETVFADLKQNQGFRRFHLRGKEKVNVELGLLSIAHNLKKIPMQTG
jgi:transposase